MNILIYGAGVIGTTYGWQLSLIGHDISLLVRKGKKDSYQEGIHIRCQDERKKQSKRAEVIFCPRVIDSLSSKDRYDLILVGVKSNQLEPILPDLAQNAGSSTILFFQNNWWGDEKIRLCLPPEQYLFGFSRLVGGWRSQEAIECIIFNAPGMSTLLGEKNGQVTPRLNELKGIFQAAGLKPEISPDILSWLKFHYVEYLGATGAILKVGSAKTFADHSELVRQAILATREGLAVCQVRGLSMKSAAFNLRMHNLPLSLITWLGQKQYQAPDIQSFFDENIRNGLDEISCQYQEVVAEGVRLGVSMPVLLSFAPYFQPKK
jgi:2-dehydropantoate 2-reductase